MRRTYFFLGLIGAVAVAAVAVWLQTPTRAQPAAGPPAAEHPAGRTLPLASVVLFNSGVGYFQREGTVEGNARVDLSFPATDVNDLLKSLVLQDSGLGNRSLTVPIDPSLCPWCPAEGAWEDGRRPLAGPARWHLPRRGPTGRSGELWHDGTGLSAAEGSAAESSIVADIMAHAAPARRDQSC
jgi:hypothetical protein